MQMLTNAAVAKSQVKTRSREFRVRLATMSAIPRPDAARLTVGVIGAGRVGAVLGAALLRAGHDVVAVSAVSEASRDRAETFLRKRARPRPAARGAGAGLARGNDFALLVGETPEHLRVFVIDCFDFVDGEEADLSSPASASGATP